MGAILNGMVLSKLRAYGSGFMIFSDYMRAPIRLSSLMEIPVMYIFTHDSIGVGEDGPTHQPIEQLIALRAIPQLLVIRPADGNEVAEAWRVMMSSSHHPIALILSRQPLPTMDRTKYAAATGLKQGAYVLADSDGAPEVIFMGTGSELQLCVAAHEQLKAEGVKSRVVSMPCWELFERQPKEYRESVLPRSVRARVAVEAGTSLGWRRYTGIDGRIIARREFGASAPLKELLKQFGFTVEKVVEAARESMSEVKGN
jgi:transketolase